MKGTEIGIIGFGQFGRLAARILRKHAPVVVSDENDLSHAAKRLGVRFVSVEEAASRKAVLLAVPISAMEQALKKIKPYLQKGALLVDVCSVKMRPVELMKKIAPANVSILGAHPLFGPQSGKHGIRGRKIILCPVRISRPRVNRIKGLLEKKGLNVLIMSAREHDREIAKTQVLTHFIAKALDRMGMHSNVSTMSSELFAQAVALVKEDSVQLFRDIQNENPFAAEWRRKCIRQLVDIDKEIIN